MKHRHYPVLLALTLGLVSAVHAQVIQSVGTLMRGKSILEFYEAAIANPQEVILLMAEIKGQFRGSPGRYEGLSNEYAQTVGWFESGPLALEFIELGTLPSEGHEFGYFSIALRQLTYKQCVSLSGGVALKSNFLRVERNGTAISSMEAIDETKSACRTQWFFQSGKNEVKFIGY